MLSMAPPPFQSGESSRAPEFGSRDCQIPPGPETTLVLFVAKPGELEEPVATAASLHSQKKETTCFPQPSPPTVHSGEQGRRSQGSQDSLNAGPGEGRCAQADPLTCGIYRERSCHQHPLVDVLRGIADDD